MDVSHLSCCRLEAIIDLAVVNLAVVNLAFVNLAVVDWADLDSADLQHLSTGLTPLQLLTSLKPQALPLNQPSAKTISL
jgi:hypothetical protein